MLALAGLVLVKGLGRDPVAVEE
jgi:hypothetical protein